MATLDPDGVARLTEGDVKMIRYALTTHVAEPADLSPFYCDDEGYDFYADWSGLRETYNIREARERTDIDYEGMEFED